MSHCPWEGFLLASESAPPKYFRLEGLRTNTPSIASPPWNSPQSMADGELRYKHWRFLFFWVDNSEANILCWLSLFSNRIKFISHWVTWPILHTWLVAFLSLFHFPSTLIVFPGIISSVKNLYLILNSTSTSGRIQTKTLWVSEDTLWYWWELGPFEIYLGFQDN